MIYPYPVTISVLMAVFNTPFELVKRAIDSVLCQDFQDFELIVLDDGSDEVLGIKLLQYCQLHQAKVTFLRHQNCGQSQSINRGVKLCHGAYIAIIDSDDEYKPNHLSACLNEMQHTDLISSSTETIVSSEADYYVPDKYDYEKNIHVDECILFATLFGKKEIFERLSFKNMYAADAHFYAQASLLYRVKKVDLRTYIYYRNITDSVTATLKRNQLLREQS
jgi:glycosyltransferase involved in cell wall biosynthesis